MTDNNAFERFVADHLSDDGSGLAQAEQLAALIYERTSERRQLSRWLALIKEPPMRTNSRTTVGDPTTRVIAVMAATLLLIVAMAAVGAGAQRLLAADGPIVVAADGSGHFTTIQAAVDAAEDGDEILVKPSVYAESVLIDGLDIVLRGDGARDEIVIEAPADQPPIEAAQRLPFGLAIVDSDASISGLTLRGYDSRVHVAGGAPALESLTLDQVGEVFTGGNSTALDSIAFYGPSAAVLSGSEVIAGGSVSIHTRAEPQIVDNALSAGTNIYVKSPGPATLIEDNTIIDAASRAIGIWDKGPFTIRGNTIDNPSAEAILDDAGSSALIADNDISGEWGGIHIRNGSDATVTDNRLNVGSTGISIANSPATISGNTIDSGTTGIVVSGTGSSPTITGNAIDATVYGMIISGGTTPIISGNTVCGTEAHIEVQGGAEPELGENVTCDLAANE